MIDDDTTGFLSQRDVLTGIGIALLMMLAIVWMPAMLGVLHVALDLPAGKLSLFAFAELLGFLSGTLASSGRSLPALRRWLPYGCAVLICVDVVLALLRPHALPLLLALRVLAGAGAGIGFGFGLKSCGASRKMNRDFGLFTGSMSIMMVIGFKSLAWATDSWGLIDGKIDPNAMMSVAVGVWLTFAAAGLGALALGRAGRSQAAAGTGQSAGGQRGAAPMQAGILFGLAAILLTFMGQGGVWAFLQVLGISYGFSVLNVSNAMSVFALSGIVGSFCAAAIPTSIPRLPLFLLTLIALFAALRELYMPGSFLLYVGASAIAGFYWNFIYPLILGQLARMDPTGRAPTLGGAMSTMGSGTGPLVAGLIIAGTDYKPVGWMVAAFCAAAVLCIVLVERLQRNVVQAEPSAG